MPQTAKSLRASTGGIHREDMHTLLPDVYPTLDADEAVKWGNNQWVDSGKPLLCPAVANPLTARMHKGINTTLDEGQTPIVDYCQDVADPITAHEQRTYTHEGSTFRTRNVTAIRENHRAEVTEHDVADAVTAGGGKPGQGYPAVRDHMAVRRLTPTECERLQGFPDGYTDIPGASDSARYKALGNSMAVPVMHWIGQRINHVQQRSERDE